MATPPASPPTILCPRIKRPDAPMARPSAPSIDDARADARFGSIDDLTMASLIEDGHSPRR